MDQVLNGTILPRTIHDAYDFDSSRKLSAPRIILNETSEAKYRESIRLRRFHPLSFLFSVPSSLLCSTSFIFSDTSVLVMRCYIGWEMG
jgi:hypothetical protein